MRGGNHSGANAAAELATGDGFIVIAAKAQMMQNHANMPRNIKYLLFEEAVKTVTKLDWLIVMTLKGVTKSRVEHYCDKVPSFASH